MDKIIDFFSCLSKIELFTFFIGVFTGLTVIYYRKTFKAQKPSITRIYYMYEDTTHLFLTIVNNASHRIVIKYTCLIRFFLIIPIVIQNIKFDDPTDKEQDLVAKELIYDRPRTFIEKEDTLHFSLKKPLKVKSFYLLLVKTRYGFSLRIFRPQKYLIDKSE